MLKECEACAFLSVVQRQRENKTIKFELQFRVVGCLVGHHGAACGANTGTTGELKRHRELVVQELEHLGNALLALQIDATTKCDKMY